MELTNVSIIDKYNGKSSHVEMMVWWKINNLKEFSDDLIKILS